MIEIPFKVNLLGEGRGYTRLPPSSGKSGAPLKLASRLELVLQA
jgi:hypothetical protein